MNERFPRIGGLSGVEAFRFRLAELALPLPCDDAPLPAPTSPLAAPLLLGRMRGQPRAAANRFVVQPMEGWDGNPDGTPSALTERRWRNFGRSGAGLIWGGEAVAVRADGRANPNQLLMTDATAPALGALRRSLIAAARQIGTVGHQEDPVVGLQLTHSGRWSRPDAAGPAPLAAFRHPLLDGRSHVDDDSCVASDDSVKDLVRHFGHAAHLAQEEGFDFVDIKHCHGYLLHEFLAARRRRGPYGGPSLEERARLSLEIIAAVRDAASSLGVGVRLSVFDAVPHRPHGLRSDGAPGPGVPEEHPVPYDLGFGVDTDDPARTDLREPVALLRMLAEQDVKLVNVTAGSPYYVPHIQRPAAFPPSDGYAPPEDPLVGVWRLLDAARQIKQALPELVVVSSGWTYLQEYLPHVAQACVRDGWFDAVGLGRMVLSCPELPADVLAGRPLARQRICRTFSDCTTAPRSGLVSGCYPLDPFYRERPERGELEHAKQRRRAARDA